MTSFEFYGRETYASCQYDADRFFVVLDDTDETFPLLERAHRAFINLHDEVFLYSTGETTALKKEIVQIVKVLQLDLQNPAGKYVEFSALGQELEAVFSESEMNKTDIRFRWG